MKNGAEKVKAVKATTLNLRERYSESFFVNNMITKNKTKDTVYVYMFATKRGLK